MTDQSRPLSSAGMARRSAMRGELVAQVGVVRRARRRRRSALGALGLTMTAGLAWAIAPRADQPQSHKVVVADIENAVVSPAPPAVHEPFRITRHGTPDGVLSRYTVVEDHPGLIQRSDDATLLASLAAINRPAGLIVIDGRAQLTADVTDAAVETPDERG